MGARGKGAVAGQGRRVVGRGDPRSAGGSGGVGGSGGAGSRGRGAGGDPRSAPVGSGGAGTVAGPGVTRRSAVGSGRRGRRRGRAGRAVDGARVLLPAWRVQPGWGSLGARRPAALKAEMLTRYGVAGEVLPAWP